MYSETKICCEILLQSDEKCTVLKEILETAYPGFDIYKMDIWQRFEDFKKYFKQQKDICIGEHFISYGDWYLRYDERYLELLLFAPEPGRRWRHHKNRDFYDRMMRQLSKMVYDKKIEVLTDQKKYIFGTERAVFKMMGESFVVQKRLGSRHICVRYSLINHFLSRYQKPNLLFKYPFPLQHQ